MSVSIARASRPRWSSPSHAQVMAGRPKKIIPRRARPCASDSGWHPRGLPSCGRRSGTYIVLRYTVSSLLRHPGWEIQCPSVIRFLALIGSIFASMEVLPESLGNLIAAGRVAVRLLLASLAPACQPTRIEPLEAHREP